MGVNHAAALPNASVPGQIFKNTAQNSPKHAISSAKIRIFLVSGPSPIPQNPPSVDPSPRQNQGFWIRGSARSSPQNSIQSYAYVQYNTSHHVISHHMEKTNAGLSSLCIREINFYDTTLAIHKITIVCNSTVPDATKICFVVV